MGNGLHLHDIQLLADRVKRFSLMILEGLEQRVIRHLHALHERIILIRGIRKRQGQVIDRRQDVLQDIRLSIAVDVLTIAGRALLGTEKGQSRMPLTLALHGSEAAKVMNVE